MQALLLSTIRLALLPLLAGLTAAWDLQLCKSRESHWVGETLDDSLKYLSLLILNPKELVASDNCFCGAGVQRAQVRVLRPVGPAGGGDSPRRGDGGGPGQPDCSRPQLEQGGGLVPTALHGPRVDRQQSAQQ